MLPEVDAGKVRQVIEEFRARHRLCELALYLWSPKDFALIKASTRGSGAAGILLPELSPEEPEYYEPVRIDVPGQAAKQISTFKQALMHQVFNFRYRAIRVYAQINNNSDLKRLIQDELIPERELGLDA